jgi:hypothetical protein
MEDIEGILRSVVNEADKKTKGDSNPGSPPNADSMSSEAKEMFTNIQVAMEEANARSKATVVRTEADIAKTDFFSDIMIQSGNDLATAQQTIKMQADIGALEVQENAKRVRDAAGGVDFQVAQIGSLTESQQNTIRLQDEKADILDDELTGIGIFDAALNMFRVGTLSSQIEKSQRKSAGTTNQIQQLTQSQESFGRVNAQAASTINQGTIAAGQSALAAQASIDEAKAKLNQVFSNGEAYARLEVASGQEVKNLVKTLEINSSLEAIAVRKDEMAFRREQVEADKELVRFQVPAAEAAAKLSAVNLSIAELRAQLLTFEVKSQPDKKAQLERDIEDQNKRAIILQNEVNNIGTKNQSLEQNVEAQRLNLVNAQNNIDANPDKVRAAKVTLKNAEDALADREMRKQTMATNVRTGQAIAGVAVEQVDAVIMQGIDSGGATGRKLDLLMEIAGTGVIGFDPATARSNLAQLGNFKPTKGTKLLEEATVQQNSLGAENALYKKPNTVEGVAAEFNQVARSLYKGKEVNIATGDMSNPLHAPNFAVLSRKASISGTALYQNVLKDKGMTETNPQTIVDAAMAGVIAKKITIEEAKAGVEAIFDQAAASNNILEGGLERVGFPNQSTYNVRLSLPPNFLDDFSLVQGVGIVAGVVTGQNIAQQASQIINANNEGFGETTIPVNLMDSASLSVYWTKLMSRTKGAPSTPNP